MSFNDEKVISASEMITKVFSNIDATQIQNGNKVISAWQRTVASIKSRSDPNIGQKLAGHSKVVDLKNGILMIETDHSGWIQMLQLYQNYILNGLHRLVPAAKISTLTFKLEGTSARLAAEQNEEAKAENREKMIQKLDEEEKILEKSGYSGKNQQENSKNKELPENLKNIFDRFKNEMLTNSK